MKKTAAVMLQGTGSDVGKSLLAAGLCRLFTRRGLRVRPFKPQNMSNNAAVTADGGEIGRAQALQARACGVEPTSDMNPVLLKPESDRGCQIVLQGRVWGAAGAMDYQRQRSQLMPYVMESYDRLRDESDLVIVEGAGSISEVNLRDGDIANMGFAVRANVPVALVADIDRGGAIASIVGSHSLLPPGERELLKGYIVNKFRGDIALFSSAIDIVRERTGLGCLGVVPWFSDASKLPAEDSLALTKGEGGGADGAEGRIKIRALSLSRISNFDDFDPLAAEEGVDFAFVPPGQPIPGDADLVIIPGTKATIADLAFLRAQGWDVDILAHVRRGGSVLGICGGYQMLGCGVSDPLGVESSPEEESRGLGLLAVDTVLGDEKELRRFSSKTEEGIVVDGYEMHMGVTTGRDAGRPMFWLDGKPEGAVSADGKTRGCYVHGLFTSDEYRARCLSAFRGGHVNSLAYDRMVEETLDELANHAEENLDVEALGGIAGL